MTISALLYKYPLDLTGKNPTNLVLREPHTLGAANNRAFVCNSGPFFTKDVIVREAISGKILKPYDQYLILQPYQEASVKSGLEVAAIIYVTDMSVDTEILIDYQCVGGEFSWSVYALKAMLEAAELDSRSIHWGDIVGKPSAFRPSPHLHDLGDSYGWEYVTTQLEGIRTAILLGDAASHDELRQQLELSLDIVRNDMNIIDNALSLHKIDYTNVHRVTAAQVGLGNVLNVRHATIGEAHDAGRMALGARVGNYIISNSTLWQALTQFEAWTVAPHVNDLNDPHNVTATQVGLGLVGNYSMATKVEAEQGTSNLKYMSPQRTKEAIATQALVPLANHVDIVVGNPHKVTKADVLLGNVANYPFATGAEAFDAGNLNVDNTGRWNYMHVHAVAIAIKMYDDTTANAHRLDKNDPHDVTKAQVGLGSVENYRHATVIESQEAARLELITPATSYVISTKTLWHAFQQFEVSSVLPHAQDKNDPHDVTKLQVGLGSVENYAVATKTESEQGTVTTKYMTPLRTKEAIAYIAAPMIADHAGRTDNPHAVNKGDVLLGSVENYAVATKAEAEQGTVSVKYMTPLRTKEAITYIALSAVSTHADRTDNPHAVNKGDVLLGSVENYAVATKTEAEQGTSNLKYMTPLRTKESIVVIGQALVNAHSGIVGNPHGTSASQVGAFTKAETQERVDEYSQGAGWHIFGPGNHTFTLPAWVKRFRIQACGGGGGGGHGANYQRGGGGGAGAYYDVYAHTAAVGHTHSFTVGAGGAGATWTGNGNGNGGGGGSTILFNGNVVVGGGYGGGSSQYPDINSGGLGGNTWNSGGLWSLAFLGAGGDGSDGGSSQPSWGGSGDGGASFFGGGSRGSAGPYGLNDTAGYPSGSGGGGSTAVPMPGTGGVVIIYY